MLCAITTRVSPGESAMPGCRQADGCRSRGACSQQDIETQPLTSIITPSDSPFRNTSNSPLARSSLILTLSFVSAPRAPYHGSVFPPWHRAPLFTSANRAPCGREVKSGEMCDCFVADPQMEERKRGLTV